MPRYDFSQKLKHLNKQPLSAQSASLPRTIFFDDEAFQGQATLGNFLEPILLYTVGREDGQKPGDPARFLTEEEKLNRFSLVLKIRDGGVVEITDRDVETITFAITILPTEPHGIIRMILEESLSD